MGVDTLRNDNENQYYLQLQLRFGRMRIMLPRHCRIGTLLMSLPHCPCPARGLLPRENVRCSIPPSTACGGRRYAHKSHVECLAVVWAIARCRAHGMRALNNRVATPLLPAVIGGTAVRCSGFSWKGLARLPKRRLPARVLSSVAIAQQGIAASLDCLVKRTEFGLRLPRFAAQSPARTSCA